MARLSTRATVEEMLRRHSCFRRCADCEREALCCLTVTIYTDHPLREGEEVRDEDCLHEWRCEECAADWLEDL